MGADEIGTLKALTERRVILDKLIGDHGGRIANTAGDSVLAEFGSAVDAVQCAVETCSATVLTLPRGYSPLQSREEFVSQARLMSRCARSCQ
jgi:class 3 adenylate cyclase